MAFSIENGDILLIKAAWYDDRGKGQGGSEEQNINDKKNKMKNESHLKVYRAGHSEIGINNPKYPYLVSVWPERYKASENYIRQSEAHVFRCNASAKDRDVVAEIALDLYNNEPSYGNVRAVGSIFPGTSSGSDTRLKKYYDRLMGNLADPEGPQVKLMGEMFYSEVSVVCAQLAAMRQVSGAQEQMPTEVALQLAKKHPLWIDANAKHTAPADLLRVLRRSVSWRYVGDYMHQPTEGIDTPLAAAVRLAIGHYNQNKRSKWGLTASRESSLAVGYLAFLASPEGMAIYGDEKLRFYLKEILGIFPAAGQKVIPLNDIDVQVRRLPQKSRLRECLLLGLRQMAKPQFTFV